MAWKQLIAPDLTVQDYAGWCARFTWKVFGENSIYNYGSANEAWQGAGNPYPQHVGEMPPADASVPIYYDWGTYGHAAVWVPGRGVLSSPGSGYGQQWFDSVEACGNYFGATYNGWREDMAGVPVVEYSNTPTNKGKSEMLMIHKASGDANVWRFAIFAPGFWLEFVGQDAANGFAKQIGAASVLATPAFWDFCKKTAQTPINVTGAAGGSVNTAAIAKAVNDDAAKRMSS